MFNLFTQDIKYLKGVGPNRAELLGTEMKIFSVRDLLYTVPSKYVDRSRIYRIDEIDGNMPYIQLKGYILSFETIGEGAKRRLVAHFTDDTGVVDLVWFQGIKYAMGHYPVGKRFVVFGKPSVFGQRVNVVHPEMEEESLYTASPTAESGLQPCYAVTEKMKRRGLTSRSFEKLIQHVFSSLEGVTIPESLPPYLIEEHHLMPLTEALHEIHYPQSQVSLRKAQLRLKFEELLYVQLAIVRYMNDRRRQYRGFVFSRIGDIFNTFYREHLPFALTGAQKRVIKEIRNDVRSGKQMNRLLQGDVGSGKTLVALMSMLIALDNGFQACIVAPTEILAEQHLQTLSEMLKGMDVRVELLTGLVKGKKREAVLQGLLNGEVQILVGTHAVFEDTVKFASLGLAVIDEQHRFGVEQRAKLWAKNVNPPHILVMTATPIPRTLAMTVYGDLEVSVIDELPPGRKPVRTIHAFDNNLSGVYASIRTQLKEGRQVYFVFPLIKESEKSDLKNLEEGYEQIKASFPGFQVGKVHGKMKPSEKDEEMGRFLRKETQILVATTVIEVGVNVPNASVMVIENADRFGLAQLHQLRGRVGRGADQSYCILVTGFKLSKDTRQRLDIMTQTNDGFEIAEADLKLRGPGDLEGTQQSGIAFDLRVANVVRDSQLLGYVREVAKKVIKDDPEERNPANAVLWQQLDLLKKNRTNWAAIS